MTFSHPFVIFLQLVYRPSGFLKQIFGHIKESRGHIQLWEGPSSEIFSLKITTYVN